MRALIIFAFLLTAIPAAAQEHLGHFKRNPNGTDSISTPSGAYGEATADTVNNPIESPYQLSGEVPEDSKPAHNQASMTAIPGSAAPAANR